MLKSKLQNAAGSRNNWVTIERASNADANSVEEVLVEWSVLCGRWAGATITSGREFTAAMSVQPMLQSILELPHDPKTASITPRDRVTTNGRVLNIAAVFNQGENNEKVILWLMEPVRSSE